MLRMHAGLERSMNNNRPWRSLIRRKEAKWLRHISRQGAESSCRQINI